MNQEANVEVLQTLSDLASNPVNLDSLVDSLVDSMETVK